MDYFDCTQKYGVHVCSLPSIDVGNSLPRYVGGHVRRRRDAGIAVIIASLDLRVAACKYMHEATCLIQSASQPLLRRSDGPAVRVWGPPISVQSSESIHCRSLPWAGTVGLASAVPTPASGLWAVKFDVGFPKLGCSDTTMLPDLRSPECFVPVVAVPLDRRPGTNAELGSAIGSKQALFFASIHTYRTSSSILNFVCHAWHL